MRDSYPFTAATTPSGGHGTWPENLGSVKVGAGPAARLSVNVAPGQFRMILIRTQIQATSSKLQAASFIVDIEPYIWDNMITINKRITHDTTRKIRRFGSEAQEPARERKLYNSGATGAAGGRRRLGPRVKLRHLHAAAAGTDGRGAPRARSQTLQAGCGRTARSQVINRGLRAPSPRNKNQATSYKRQAASSKFSSRSDQASSGKRQAASSKPQAASSLIADPG